MAVFEFAIDEEGLIVRNPARKLVLPKARKRCDRFLSIEDVRRLLTVPTGREHLTLRLLLVGGLRPAEPFALRTGDTRPGVLRIDEARGDPGASDCRLSSPSSKGHFSASESATSR